MRRFAPLAIVLAVYLAVGYLYAVNTPPWQAPDEPAHYNYIRQLAAGEFPVIEAGDYDQEYQSEVISSRFDPRYSVESFEYEDYQPPLYYLVQTPVFRLFEGNLQALRLVSVLLGTGVVILTYLVASRLFPGRDWLALTAAVFVAFLPQHVAMLASVNNDSLAELLIAAIVLLLFAVASGREQSTDGRQELEYWPLVGLGILLGLGFLTKVTVYTLAPVAGIVLLWRYWHRWRAFILACMLVFGIAIVIGVGWWIRNLVVYGGVDLLGTAAHNAVVVGQPRTAQWISELGLGETLKAFFQTTFQSFWGQFGWMGVVMPAWVYWPLLAFTSLTLAALLKLAIQPDGLRSAVGLRRVRPVAGLLILGGTLLMSLAVYLTYNLTFVQHQGRYLFSALVPIAVGVALAWGLLIQPLTKRYPRAGYLLPLGLGLLLVGLDLLALYRFIIPALTVG
ncbi:MAG: glycosyltransferase family 39 protein [Chloroflexota bacterium]|jgi:4-amino-4-deoxy-L-arabinose transferase-like glycosyltransferase